MLMFLCMVLAAPQLPPKPPLKRLWTASFESRIDNVQFQGRVGFYSTWKQIGAVDLANGHKLWSVDNPREANVGLIASASKLFAVTGGGSEEAKGWLDAYDTKTGRREWHLVHTGRSKLLAMSGTTLVTQLVQDHLDAIDVRTHKPKWSAPLTKVKNRNLDGLAELMVENGTVVAAIQSGDAEVYALDAEKGRRRWRKHFSQSDRYGNGVEVTVVPAANAVAVALGNDLTLLDLRSGAARWKHHLTGTCYRLLCLGDVVVSCGGQWLEGVDARTGHNQWRTPVMAPNEGASLEFSVINGCVATYADVPLAATEAVDRAGHITWKWPTPESGTAIGWDAEELLVREQYRIVAYGHGASGVLPVSSAARSKRAQQLCADFEGLSGAEQKELSALGDDAFPAVLRVVLALDAKEGGMYDSAISEQVSSACQVLSAVSSSKRVPELVAATDELFVGSSARPAIAQMIGAKGTEVQAVSYYLGILRKASEDDRFESWGMMRSHTGVALQYVAQSSRPEAVSFLIAALKNPKMPVDIREAAYDNVARTGGEEGLKAVLAERRTLQPLPSLEDRLDLPHLARWKEGTRGGISTILDERKDAFGILWCLFVSGILGSSDDLWIAKNVGGKWTHPLFTGVSSDRWSGFVKPTPPPMTFHGKTRKQLLDGAWFDAFVGNPELEKDSDGDGLTDLVEARLGTDPNKADTDGDGMTDMIDPWPTVSRKPTTEAEKVLAAAWEARYHFYGGSWFHPALFTPPKGMQPCEFVGWPGPVLVQEGESQHPLGKLYEQGIALIGFGEIGKKDGPWEDRVIRWNEDRTEAEVSISTYFGGLSGDGYTIRVKKVGNDWVVTYMAMAYIS